jgi:endonuclease YncB( thermonuclease family)
VTASAVFEEFGPYPGIVRDWHDGDTCHVDLDLGFGFEARAFSLDEKPRLSCRIYGINAPELSTAAGGSALAYAQALCPAGTRVWVLSHGWDKYGGRFDGSLNLPGNVDFAAAMVAAGQASSLLP